MTAQQISNYLYCRLLYTYFYIGDTFGSAQAPAVILIMNITTARADYGAQASALLLATFETPNTFVTSHGALVGDAPYCRTAAFSPILPA